MTSIRVSKHTLRNEGAPYDERGQAMWLRSTGSGRGKCSCGTLSEELPSNNRRKAWHRDHKSEVLAAQDA